MGNRKSIQHAKNHRQLSIIKGSLLGNLADSNSKTEGQLKKWVCVEGSHSNVRTKITTFSRLKIPKPGPIFVPFWASSNDADSSSAFT